jgi:hypothetical protein
MAILPEVNVSRDIGRMGYTILTRTYVEDLDMNNMRSIFKTIADTELAELSKQWVQDNQGEILKHLNPQAVANLAIADSARLVRAQFIDPPKAKKVEKK